MWPMWTIGVHPTELIALHDQRITLTAALHKAMAEGCPAEKQSVIRTRMALLDADLRRN